MKYVVGFAFSPGFQNLLLVLKMRPDWQRGLLNGCGGKIEPGETDVQAMVRECWEETGLETKEGDWTPVAFLEAPDCLVTFFYTEHHDLASATAKTDEHVIIVRSSDLRNLKVIPNLNWLVPLCQHFNAEIGGRISQPVCIFI